jgi:hypothetical protein
MRNIHNVLTLVERELSNYDLIFKLKYKRDIGEDNIYILRVWQRGMLIPAKIEFMINETNESWTASVLRKGNVSRGVLTIIEDTFMNNF